MRKQLQIQLIQKAIELVESRKTEMGDEYSRNPVDIYTSPERFEKERDTLFRQFPLVVGFSSQVTKPGDYFTHDHTGIPILVVRDKDAQLHAMINVCRHRGAKLVSETSGEGKRHLVCPFHGWCYKNNGSLLAVTHPAGFPGLDKNEFGLVKLPVAERYGMVFVQPAPGPDFDIDAYLGPLFEDLGHFGFADYVMYKPSVRTKKFNWKLQMDTSHENYHFRYLHKETAGPAYFDNVSYSDYAKPHSRNLAPQKSLLRLVGTDPNTWNISDHIGILYSIFPNTGLYAFGGFAHVLSTFPVDETTSTLVGAMLVPKNFDSNEACSYMELHYESYWRTMTEDIDAAVDMQAMIRSGANKEFTFATFEGVLTKFHRAVNEAIKWELLTPRLHKTGEKDEQLICSSV